MMAFIMSVVLHYSAQYKVEPQLVMAVIQTESRFNPDETGTKGEIGLMQLMPSEFPDYTEEQLFDIETNIRLGIAHLAAVRKECKHKEDKTWVICYNLGSP